MVLSVLESVWTNVKLAFENVWAWVLYFIAFLGSFLGSNGVMYVHCIGVAVAADLLFGILKSKKQGIGFKPKGAFKAIGKYVVYIAAMLLSHLADVIIGEDTLICMKGIALVAVVTEVWSVFGNLTIIFPQMAMFSIVKKLMLSTVAEKLNMSEEELTESISKAADPMCPETDPFKKVKKTEDEFAVKNETSVNGTPLDSADAEV